MLRALFLTLIATVLTGCVHASLDMNRLTYTMADRADRAEGRWFTPWEYGRWR